MKIRLALLTGIVIILSACGNKKSDAPPPPMEVKVVEVIQKDVPIYEFFVGQVYGQEDVSINARVEGFLEGIHFDEGSRVNKGQLLYSIDSKPFEANVAEKMSAVAQAKTMLVKAENDLKRVRPLAAQNALSKSDLDAAIAERDAYESAVKAAEANLDLSRINLGYTKIYSPITGFIGKTQARVGEFVGRSPNPVILNTVSKVENVRVQFFLTEQQYLILAKEFRKNETQKRPSTDKAEISLILSDGSTHPFQGKVDFVNREVDAMTGAILVQASFPNPNLILRPGQFARVKIRMKIERNALLVPQRCISELQGQYSVFVVDDDNKIESRQLKIGEKYGDYWIVKEGLDPDDKVVLEGLQKVGSGMEVIPVITEFKSQIIQE
jgi:membrane fusion protein, multidrug efflux system